MILQDYAAIGWQMAAEPFPIFAEVPRIDHQQIRFRGQVVNQQIVHQTTSTVGHAGILNPSGKQRGYMVGSYLFQKFQGPGTADPELPHVRYIKEPTSGTNRQVFGLDAAVTDWHVKASKGNHFGMKGQVTCMEGRFADGVRFHWVC